ncbi:glycosyltransferase family 4 protein [uncultured Microbacterium sp.]|uniref:glycosyltransferase family 4 protein n=1 Tax=uncultured Microbacterium sp. TaxID=191216 RepID=UPI0025D553BB|nr:glycosyltransferase family 4 protein [uncultured Microbacterium sp.]
MRIVYLHQYFTTPAQSGGTRSYEFARRLADRGHDVHVITSTRNAGDHGGQWSTRETSGFTVHARHVPYDNSMGSLQRVRAFVTFAVVSAARARSLKGEVVFATSTPLTIFLPAWFATLGRRTPIVFEVRDSWPTVPIALGYLSHPVARWLARRLEHFAYARSAKIVALSPGMREDAAEQGADPQKISVIPNAADVSMFDVPDAVGVRWRRDHGIDVDAPLIVYTGTFGAANEVEYLVDVAREAAALDARTVFALIGSGAREAAVRSRAEDYGLLGKTVRVMPPVPKAEMPAVFSAADVATSVVTNNPAMNANSANKFFDSLAAGRAIAINHEGWQADLIRSHDVGLVLERDDLRAAAHQLLGLIADRARLAQVHRRARDLARSEFDRDVLARQLAEVLENAREGRSGSVRERARIVR